MFEANILWLVFALTLWYKLEIKYTILYGRNNAYELIDIQREAQDRNEQRTYKESRRNSRY